MNEQFCEVWAAGTELEMDGKTRTWEAGSRDVWKEQSVDDYKATKRCMKSLSMKPFDRQKPDESDIELPTVMVI